MDHVFIGSDDHLHEATTLPVLSHALKAKSTKSRLIWYGFSVAIVLGLLISTVLLVQKYQEEQTKVIIKIKRTPMPFPAVTFCNMNPYKKSALAKIAAPAELMKQYQELSNILNKNAEPEDTKRSQRKKRANDGTCLSDKCSDYQPDPSAWCSACQGCKEKKHVTYDGKTIYSRVEGCDVTWDCAFDCCNMVRPKGYFFTYNRLARIENSTLYRNLTSDKIITGTDAWCGFMAPLPLLSVPDYSWYDNPGVPNGPANPMQRCPSNFLPFPPQWGLGGFGSVTDTKFCIKNSDPVNLFPPSLSSFICEYLNVAIATTTVSTTSSTSTSSTVTTSTTASTTTSTTSSRSAATTTYRTSSTSTPPVTSPATTSSMAPSVSSSSSSISSSAAATSSTQSISTASTSVMQSTKTTEPTSRATTISSRSPLTSSAGVTSSTAMSVSTSSASTAGISTSPEVMTPPVSQLTSGFTTIASTRVISGPASSASPAVTALSSGVPSSVAPSTAAAVTVSSSSQKAVTSQSSIIGRITPPTAAVAQPTAAGEVGPPETSTIATSGLSTSTTPVTVPTTTLSTTPTVITAVPSSTTQSSGGTITTSSSDSSSSASTKDSTSQSSASSNAPTSSTAIVSTTASAKISSTSQSRADTVVTTSARTARASTTAGSTKISTSAASSSSSAGVSTTSITSKTSTAPLTTSAMASSSTSGASSSRASTAQSSTVPAIARVTTTSGSTIEASPSTGQTSATSTTPPVPSSQSATTSVAFSSSMPISTGTLVESSTSSRVESVSTALTPSVPGTTTQSTLTMSTSRPSKTSSPQTAPATTADPATTTWISSSSASSVFSSISSSASQSTLDLASISSSSMGQSSSSVASIIALSSTAQSTLDLRSTSSSTEGHPSSSMVSTSSLLSSTPQTTAPRTWSALSSHAATPSPSSMSPYETSTPVPSSSVSDTTPTPSYLTSSLIETTIASSTKDLIASTDAPLMTTFLLEGSTSAASASETAEIEMASALTTVIEDKRTTELSTGPNWIPITSSLGTSIVQSTIGGHAETGAGSTSSISLIALPIHTETFETDVVTTTSGRARSSTEDAETTLMETITGASTASVGTSVTDARMGTDPSSTDGHISSTESDGPSTEIAKPTSSVDASTESTADGHADSSTVAATITSLMTSATSTTMTGVLPTTEGRTGPTMNAPSSTSGRVDSDSTSTPAAVTRAKIHSSSSSSSFRSTATTTNVHDALSILESTESSKKPIQTSTEEEISVQPTRGLLTTLGPSTWGRLSQISAGYSPKPTAIFASSDPPVTPESNQKTEAPISSFMQFEATTARSPKSETPEAVTDPRWILGWSSSSSQAKLVTISDRELTKTLSISPSENPASAGSISEATGSTSHTQSDRRRSWNSTSSSPVSSGSTSSLNLTSKASNGTYTLSPEPIQRQNVISSASTSFRSMDAVANLKTSDASDDKRPTSFGGPSTSDVALGSKKTSTNPMTVASATAESWISMRTPSMAISAVASQSVFPDMASHTAPSGNAVGINSVLGQTWSPFVEITPPSTMEPPPFSETCVSCGLDNRSPIEGTHQLTNSSPTSPTSQASGLFINRIAHPLTMNPPAATPLVQPLGGMKTPSLLQQQNSTAQLQLMPDDQDQSSVIGRPTQSGRAAHEVSYPQPSTHFQSSSGSDPLLNLQPHTDDFIDSQTMSSAQPRLSANQAAASSSAERLAKDPSPTVGPSVAAAIDSTVAATKRPLDDYSASIPAVNGTPPPDATAAATNQSNIGQQTVKDLRVTTSPPENDLRQAISDILDPLKHDPRVMSSTTQDLLAYFMAYVPPYIAEEAGYTVYDVIKRCIYDGQRCEPEMFQRKVDPNYGNCYTFNANGSHVAASRVGSVAGLKVTYYVGQEEYLDHIETSGARVVVHGQTDPIFPDVMGISVASGFQSTITMTKIQQNAISTLSKPCANTPDDVTAYNYYNDSYTVKACQRSCYQKNVIQQCGCGDPRIALPRDHGVTYCSISQRECVNNVSTAGSGCSCPIECTVFDHRLTQSTARWPPFQDQQIRTAFPEVPYEANSSRKNQFITVDVYYEDLSVIEYTEVFAYDWNEFMYELSGILGVFTGMSVMSAFELFSLIAYLHRKYYSR